MFRRKICAVFLIVSLVGCATTQGVTPANTKADVNSDCSQFEAAWNLYVRAADPVELTKKSAKECKDPLVCITVPLAPIFFTAYFILGTVLVFPVFLFIPDAKERGCPKKDIDASKDNSAPGNQQE